MIEQTLEINGKEIILTNTANIDQVIKDNYEDRMVGNNGWSENRTMRRICSIPSWMFTSEPLLREYRAALPVNEREAREILSKWLDRNPWYRVNNGGI